jgi:4-carboxymuconolactone decarboxylase
MPRINTINGKADLPAEHHGLADHVLKVFGGIRGPMSILMHNPKLARPLMDVGDYFRDQSVVPAKLRILAILIAARERQGAYVWAAQVNAARRAGIAEETIGRIRSRAPIAAYPPEEREIVAYAEQLMKNNRVDQATFDALKNRYGPAWLIELTTAMTYYAMLSNVVSAFEVAVPAEGDKLPT